MKRVKLEHAHVYSRGDVCLSNLTCQLFPKVSWCMKIRSASLLPMEARWPVWSSHMQNRQETTSDIANQCAIVLVALSLLCVWDTTSYLIKSDQIQSHYMFSLMRQLSILRWELGMSVSHYKWTSVKLGTASVSSRLKDVTCCKCTMTLRSWSIICEGNVSIPSPQTCMMSGPWQRLLPSPPQWHNPGVLPLLWIYIRTFLVHGACAN